MVREEVKAYAKFVTLAAAVVCAAYYAIFLVGMLTSADAGSVKDRAGAAAALLLITPFTLAGYWWATIPAVLSLGWLLKWTWPKLSARLTGWRPHTAWQYLLVGVMLAYGGASVLLLTLCTLFAIPSTFAGP